ncbi:MAG: hypothetical protein L0Z52_07230 [Acidobacteria bacterium]|nr:hypothetical protein [Acidobacteriota bacterium]
MSQKDDCYIIEEDDLLEPVRRLGRAGTKVGGGSLRGLDATVRASTRRGYGARGNAPLASSLSLFICGAGQVANGQWKLGVLLFLTEVLALVGHWSVLKAWPFFRGIAHIFAVSEEELFLALAAGDFLLVFFLLYNIAQAYHQGEASTGEFQGIGVPMISGLASLLVPGWGQILNAQLGKGLFFLFCVLAEIYVVALLVLTSFFQLFPQVGLESLIRTRGEVVQLILFFFASMIWILSVYDAYLVGRYSTYSRRG